MKILSMSPEQSELELSADRPSILIRDHGNGARIHPAQDALLTELLVERLRFRPDARGGLRRESEVEHLFDLDAGGLAVPSGLVPRLADAARRAGYGVEIQDLADAPIAASAPDIAGLDDDRQRLVAALARSRRGVVLARSHDERIAVLGLAIELFGAGKLMVVTKTRSDARKITRGLQVGRREPVACFTRQHSRSDARIQVGTAGSLDLTVAGVVVFADATHVLHERVRHQLLFLRRQRIYGLLSDRARLSRRERLVIEGYIGPIIGGLGPPDEHPVEVRAVFADWPGSDRPDEPLGLEWKRRSIWRNAERNGAIARLAAALAGGEAATLWQFGLFLDDDPELRSCAGRRVAVLVESPEHAHILGRLLPGWAVMCADGAGPVGRPGTAGSAQADGDGLPRFSITTWLHARGRGRIEADVVIRADGTPWPLDLPLAAPRRQRVGPRPVLLVDLADHQDRTARNATQSRRLDYRDRGWGQ